MNSDHGNAARSVRPEYTHRPRQFFVDNLRSFLVILVVLTHLSITFGGLGLWYLHWPTDDLIVIFVLTMFNAVNETFLIGFLFLISGYFTPESYDRKGPSLFLRDRLLRLGVPLIVYDAVVFPIFICAFVHVWGEFYHIFDLPSPPDGASIWKPASEYFNDFQIGHGPLWFLQRLLVFNLMYVLWRVLTRRGVKHHQRDTNTPGNIAIVGFALLLGIATFVLRIWVPARTPLHFHGVDFPLFPPQWIILFILGIIARRRNWLQTMPDTMARFWLGVLIIAIVVIAPVMFMFGGAAAGDVSRYFGGIYWETVVYAVWQQFVCVGMIICLLTLFRKRVGHHGTLARAMSASSYTVYIIHTPVIILIGMALRDSNLYPLTNFVLSALVALPLCFLLGDCIRRLPLARRVL